MARGTGRVVLLPIMDKLETCRSVARQIMRRDGDINLGYDEEDVFQEACICALEIDESVENFGGYVYFKTLNALSLRYKKRRKYRDRELGVWDKLVPSYDDASRRDAKIDADELLRRLPDDVREVVRRHFFLDESIDSMAREIGLSRAGLRHRVQMAFARLRGLTYQEYIKERAAKERERKNARFELLARDASAFPPLVQKVVELARTGKTVPEIADALGMSDSAVDDRLHEFLDHQTMTFVDKKAKRRLRQRRKSVARRIEEGRL